MVFSIGGSLCAVPGLLSSRKCLAPILNAEGGRLWLPPPPNRFLWCAGVNGLSVEMARTVRLASVMILAGAFSGAS